MDIQKHFLIPLRVVHGIMDKVGLPLEDANLPLRRHHYVRMMIRVEDYLRRQKRHNVAKLAKESATEAEETPSPDDERRPRWWVRIKHVYCNQRWQVLAYCHRFGTCFDLGHNCYDSKRVPVQDVGYEHKEDADAAAQALNRTMDSRGTLLFDATTKPFDAFEVKSFSGCDRIQFPDVPSRSTDTKSR